MDWTWIQQNIFQIFTGAGIVSGLFLVIFNAFMKRLPRDKTRKFFFKWYSLGRKKLVDYDIPIIDGAAEEAVDERILFTLSDQGIAAIAVGSDLEMDDVVKMHNDLVAKRNNLRKALNGMAPGVPNN